MVPTRFEAVKSTAFPYAVWFPVAIYADGSTYLNTLMLRTFSSEKSAIKWASRNWNDLPKA
jgi:hypothetical protein